MSVNNNPKEFEVHPKAKKLMGGSKMDNCMLEIYGVTINVREYALNHHPGGHYILCHACGNGDISNLFESIHMNTKQAQRQVRKLYEEQTGKTLPWDSMKTDPLLDDLKQVVFKHFGKHYKAIDDYEAMFGLLFMVLTLVYFIHYWMQGCLWTTIPLAGVMVCILGNWAHEGSHCCFARDPKLNYLVNCLGLPFFWCPASWTRQHCIKHHLHTNTNEDIDISHWPGTRLHRRQTFQGQWQNVKMFLKIGMGWMWMAIEAPWIFVTRNELPAPLYFSTWIELFCVMFFLGYPFLYFDFWHAFALAFIPRSFGFYYFTVITHVSHVQECCQQEQQNSWGATMVETSLDYAYDSLPTSVLVGHLNLQSVHHCLPSVTQWKLRKIYPDLVAVFSKHGVTHNYVPSFGHIFSMWLAYMRKLATEFS